MRIFSTVAVVAAILLGHPATAAPSASPAPQQVAQVDTPLMLSGGARFIAPKGWSIRGDQDAYTLGAPEGDSHIVIADGGSETSDAAIAAAWAIYMPNFSAEAQRAARPAREGWDETIRYRYETPAGVPRDLVALALRKGVRWIAIISDVTNAVAEKRDGQLEIIFNSLLPEGYERESFAGRNAHRLDAARIAELSDLIEIAREEYDIPGVALGLIDNGEVVFSGGFGVRELGRPELIDADTLFNIASNGKALTTLLLAKLVEDGRFDWETPVATLWPEFRLGDEKTTRGVKVKHLVCACTGMPRQDFELLFDGDSGFASAASVMDLLSNMRPTSGFGDAFQYSNLMAAAAGYFGGHVLYPKRELGAAYDKAMQRLVFSPLNMKATTADFGVAFSRNHAAAHAPDLSGTMQVAEQGPNLSAISTRPAGNHWSSVNDMLRYVRIELDKGRMPGGRRFINEAALLARREPQVATGLNEYYGMGLKIDRQWGVTVIHHGGSAAGYRSDMMWLPDFGVGAVLLTNADTGSSLRAAFRRRLQEVLFDGAPEAVDDLRSASRGLRESIAATRASLNVPANVEAARRLAPSYLSENLGALVVRERDGATYFDFGGWNSEVATRQGADGAVAFVTISPGVEGFEFVVANEDGARRLVLRDAQNSYLFLAE